MDAQKIENGFEKLRRLIEEKNSRLILGLDPTDEEYAKVAQQGGIAEYFKKVIDEASPYIVGIKPNLAFYEHSEETRKAMAELIAYANEIGLSTIMDAKRGDIMDTQKAMAKADKGNFNPDIVTLHSYPGSDAVKPFLDANPKTCAYIISAMSNPSAMVQELTVDGIKVAAQVALDAHKWGDGRVGLVVGSTQGKTLEHIRMVEKEYGYEPSMVLAPGLGKQGGKPFADKYSVFPISSGLTKDKYLNGRGVGEAAKEWRDNINAVVEQTKETPSLREYAINSLIEGGFVKTAKSADLIADGFFLKKGKTKLTTANIALPNDKEEKIAKLRSLVTDGVLSKDDFAALFINLRDIMGMSDIEARNIIGHLYTKQVKDSGVKPEVVGGVPYGAIFPAIQVANNLGVPFVTERKEADMTHDRMVGGNHEGKQGIIVEDILTSGGSSIEFANSLRDSGIEVNDVYAFLDRQQGAAENFKKANLNLHAVADMDYLKYMIKKNPTVDEGVKELI
ncbi:MAG: orotidine-5'-phosphate decarboxylase [Christensenellaceae bacterium]|jgi:orotate phosphoribosyltransferase|nr:orotidine-5'-phosphate decarboxylase [Christensenellaceae bacterium]